MGKKRRELLTHTFKGPRFEDHGLDIDVLPDLIAFKNILVETAKELWRRKNPGRQRLPKNFEESLNVKFYELRPGSTAVPLVREISYQEGTLEFEPPPDELDEAVALVTAVIDAASKEEALPDQFPSKFLVLFDNYGRSLKEGEGVELWPSIRALNHPAAVYTLQVRKRLSERAIAPYEDAIDIIGTVTMARIIRPRMAIQLPDGREVEAAFRPEDEDIILSALKDHTTARLRVEGRALFSSQGVIERITQVTRMTLLRTGELEFDSAAKPIWEEFDEVISTVPKEQLQKLPADAAENHDHYIYGIPKRPS